MEISRVSNSDMFMIIIEIIWCNKIWFLMLIIHFEVNVFTLTQKNLTLNKTKIWTYLKLPESKVLLELPGVGEGRGGRKFLSSTPARSITKITPLPKEKWSKMAHRCMDSPIEYLFRVNKQTHFLRSSRLHTKIRLFASLCNTSHWRPSQRITEMKLRSCVYGTFFSKN